MANVVYGNPAQGYTAPPGAKVDKYGYIEGSQAQRDMATARANNPNLIEGSPTGGVSNGFVGGSAPVNVTQEGVSVSGAKPVPQTPNIPPLTTPGSPFQPGAQLSNVPVAPSQQTAQNAYNQGVATQNAETQARYRQAFEQVKGTQPAATQGQALGVINQNLSAPASPSVAQQMVTVDPMIGQIQQMYSQYFQPANQRQSLTQEYQNLVSASGIQALDMELINMKNIIDGTEDDIRNEVMKAGGFATDSQVLALTSARNKQLIKNYNTLLETRNSKEKYLDTMMNLSIEDRKQADADFDRMIGFQEKMIEYRDKMETNARNAYQKVVDTVGYDGAYQSALSSGDPYAISDMENRLGIMPGQLVALAELDASARARKAEMENLDIQAKQAQIANTYSQIREREATTVNGIPEKVMSKLQAAPEYKAINAVLPAINAIKAYKTAIDKYGTGEMISGEGEGQLEGTYSNALVAWKSLAALGALSGADFALAESAIPKPTLWTRTSKQQAKLEASLQNALTQTDALTKRLIQNYPSAANLLSQQLSDIQVNAVPTATLSSADIKKMDEILK